MAEIQQRDMPACSESAFQRAKALSWGPIAEKTLEAYQYGPERP